MNVRKKIKTIIPAMAPAATANPPEIGTKGCPSLCTSGTSTLMRFRNRISQFVSQRTITKVSPAQMNARVFVMFLSFSFFLKAFRD